MAGNDSNGIMEAIGADAVFIVGAGHFGSRAARIISEKGNNPQIIVLDVNEKHLSQINGLTVKKIPCDGIHFLVENYDRLNSANTIVPALPLHLAFEWLREYLKGAYHIRKISVPGEVEVYLPHTWTASEGSLLVSYANFVCPEDCPEPECCTVTGQRRDSPLHDLLSHLNLTGFQVHVIRSRQLAPGLGGYTMGDLIAVSQRLTGDRQKKWLLATACNCHGIVTAFDIFPHPGLDKQRIGIDQE